MDEGIRLQRYLSQCGIAARRKAEELIESGAVNVNGQRVTELGTKVVPGKDRVTVDGEAVYPEDLFYVLLNKPKGCLTAVSDPEGRPTVMEFLPNVPVHVAPVGRLDFYSEGVLLLTNDGELSARLQSPAHHVEKTYHVKVRDQVNPRHLEALRQGVRLDDGVVTRPAQVDVLTGTKSKHHWLVITLIEGKSRQIHRMLGALGYQVMKLQRVAYASLTFHGLRVGDARELTQVEVNSLRDLVGLSKNTVARGKWNARREDTDIARRALARGRIRTARGRSEEEQFEGRGGPPRGQGPLRAGAAPRPRGPGRGPRPGGFGGFGEGTRPRGPGRGPRPEGFGGFGEGTRPRGPRRGPRPEGFGGSGEGPRSRGPSRGPRPEGFGGSGEGPRSRGPSRGPRPGGFGGSGEGPRSRGPSRGPRPEGYGGSGEGPRSRGPGRGPRPGGFGGSSEGPRVRGPGRPQRPQGRAPLRPGKPRSPRGQ
jgi:23S rRNA pseudouridine2605 synthase